MSANNGPEIIRLKKATDHIIIKAINMLNIIEKKYHNIIGNIVEYNNYDIR